MRAAELGNAANREFRLASIEAFDDSDVVRAAALDLDVNACDAEGCITVSWGYVPYSVCPIVGASGQDRIRCPHSH